MNVKELCEILAKYPDQQMHWILPDKSFIPEHYHVTEIGKIQKDFIDCGGTTHQYQNCNVQIWVANDTEHHLKTDKLLNIFKLSNQLINDDLSVEIEYEDVNTSYYRLTDYEPTPKGPLFYLSSKHTTCLAPDKCKVQGCC